MKRTLAWVMLACAWISFSASAADPSGDAQQPAGISYKGVNIQLGGFLASELVYRDNNTASDIGTSFNKIPFNNSAGYGMPEFRGTERQSRFSLLAQGESDSLRFTGYYELDFLGTSATANANESNSYTPRTRHVYMAMDWEDSGFHLLAGQTWSLVTLNSKGIAPRSEFIPQTIDAQYAAGFNWARQWQLRFTKDWSKTYWLAISLENAQTTPTSAAGIGAQPTGTANTSFLAAGNSMDANLSINGYPDVVAKFAADPGFGHYEVYGLMRNFQSRYGASAATSTTKQDVWTEAVGAGVIVPVVPQTLDIAVTGLFGKGIGRYGTSSLNDVTYALDGSLAPMTGAQYLAQINWHAGSEWEVYAAYGQESLSSATVGGTFGYGDGAVASNAGCLTLAGTCAPNIKSVGQANLGFWWSFYKGGFGTTKLGVQYSHTTVDTFADASGLAPTTKEDMVFTSLRFYPF